MTPFLPFVSNTLNLPEANEASLLFFGALKIGFLIAYLLFMIFAAVMVRQVKLMRETISTPLEPLLRLLAWIQLIVSVIVFIFAFISL